MWSKIFTFYNECIYFFLCQQLSWLSWVDSIRGIRQVEEIENVSDNSTLFLIIRVYLTWKYCNSIWQILRNFWRLDFSTFYFQTITQNALQKWSIFDWEGILSWRLHIESCDFKIGSNKNCRDTHLVFV